MLKPFLIVALPRSRTAWLARFLSYLGRICQHEPSLRWTGEADFERWLTGYEGASDTMMAWLAHEAKRRRPDLPIVVIRRPRLDVLASLAKLDYSKEPWLPWWLGKLDDRLDRIEDDLDCLSYTFDQLRFPTVCASIFHHCLGERMPIDWWKGLKDENVQADIAETLRVLRGNEQNWSAIYRPRYQEVV